MAKKSEAAPGKPVAVKFIRQWCSAERTYTPGTEAEVPEEIAASLEAEGVVEITGATE